MTSSSSPLSEPVILVAPPQPAELYEHDLFRRHVGAIIATLVFLLSLWFGLLTLTATQDGLAAGRGGTSKMGIGGDGSGYFGKGEGGGGGTGNDPVPLAANDKGEPRVGAYTGSGKEMELNDGDSFADRNRRPGTFTFSLNKAADPQPAQGAAAPGTGAGGGIEGTNFFGVKSEGRRFVYIVDCSGSMAGLPFQRAKQEMIKTVSLLNEGQSFYVMFFDDATYCQFGEPGPPSRVIPAIASNKRRLTEWVDNLQVRGGTNPEQALIWAISLKPDAIFLMTDGVFPPHIVDSVSDFNKKRIRINTIAFLTQAGEPLLKDLARRNRGDYRFQP